MIDKKIIAKCTPVVFLFLPPLLAVFLTKYIVGEYFLDYSMHGDAALELANVKLYSSSLFNHIYADPNMGAPLLADAHFWPWRQLGIGSYYYIIGLFETDLRQIYKIFYYSLFPACSLTMFLSLRYFLGVPNLISLGLSTLYTFMPFMFSNNLQHGTVLINNVSIPLLLGTVYYVGLKSYEKKSFLEYFKSKITIVLSLIVVFSATLSLYNCFYSLVFFLFLIGREFLSEKKDKTKIQMIFFLLGLNILITIFNIYPHIQFKNDSIFTLHMVERNFVHTTLYGITIVEFFVPVKNHIFEFFQFINNLYRQNTMIKSEYDFSYLGIIGALSFSISIAYVFIRHKPGNNFSKRIAFLGSLLILLLLLFSRGGLITVFYLYTDFLVLGSHYRITPWITCISLMVAGLILYGIYQKLIYEKRYIKKFSEIQTKGILFFLFVGLISFSLFDYRGNRPHFTKDHMPDIGEISHKTYKEEKSFYALLNKEIADEDMILQLPYVCYPETKKVFGTDYRNNWAYVFINKKTRFSNVALNGGTACSINSQISSMSENVAEMIKYAIYYGYTGLIVDKNGYEDKGDRLIARFSTELNLTPVINSKYIYFDIKGLHEKFAKLKVTPIEGDSLNKITKLSSINIRENEIRNLMELFPTACKNTMPEDIIKSLENSDFFSRKNCSPQKLYNKEFFYFADDGIVPHSNLKMDKGQISVKKEYIGKILSVPITQTLDEGIYRIIPRSNNINSLNNNLFGLKVNLWGRNFITNKDLTVKFEKKTKGTKLKPIWISLFKKNISDENLKIRSITIRKIQSLPPQPSSYIKNFYKMVEELVEGLRMLKLNIKGGLDVIKE